jgi:DNA processing protein
MSHDLLQRSSQKERKKINHVHNDSLLQKIALTKIPKVGPVTARNLISYCGSVEAVFKTPPKELRKIPGIGEQLARYVHSPDPLRLAEAEINQLNKNQIQVLFFLDDNYPTRLRAFPDSPLLLYLQGNADLNTEKIVSIVGTRQPSSHGLAFCEEFITQLKEYQPLIVSGLAYGIDICAHRKALEVGLPTLGVVAHGLEHLYPPSHRSYAQKMKTQGGVLTEYGYSTTAEKEFFPMRNRIIAGLCDALLVVETNTYGGSMITAQFANDYNKDVFAVPGRPKDQLSAGCNELIKNHQAHLIESAAELVAMLRWDAGIPPQGIQQELFRELDTEEKNIVDLLHHNDEKGIDALTIEARKSHSEIAALLLQLEFKGVVRALPGKRYLLNP